MLYTGFCLTKMTYPQVTWMVCVLPQSSLSDLNKQDWRLFMCHFLLESHIYKLLDSTWKQHGSLFILIIYQSFTVSEPCVYALRLLYFRDKLYVSFRDVMVYFKESITFSLLHGFRRLLIGKVKVSSLRMNWKAMVLFCKEKSYIFNTWNYVGSNKWWFLMFCMSWKMPLKWLANRRFKQERAPWERGKLFIYFYCKLFKLF